MLPPTKARVSRFAENPPPLADVLSGDMQCDFYEDREVLHPAPEGCAIKHRVVFYDGVQVLDAAPWQLQPGVPQLLEGSQHAPTDLLRWRVELGADCEVAVADVSFMAMAGAPGASRALSTTIGRLIEPFITRPLNEREKEIAPRGHHEPAEPRKRKKEGRKATSQKQNNLRIFNGSNISNISNISSVSNRYSGYIGNQMLFGWVTQVAFSLGIHLAVAGGSRPTLSFLGISEH